MLKRFGYYNVIWQENNTTYWTELKRGFRKLTALSHHYYSGLDLSGSLKTIQSFQQRKKYFYRGVIFCLPDEQVIKKILYLDRALTKAEIELFIKTHEFKEYYQASSQYVIDFEVSSIPQQDNKTSVCCVIVPRSTIRDIEELFTLSHLKLYGINVMSLMITPTFKALLQKIGGE